MPIPALKRQVDLLLLSVLEAEPAHGYRLVEALRERSEGVFELAEGTIYPALYRLERQRLVASTWDTVGGRKRRMYRLTARGGRELSRQRSEWRTYVEAVEAVVA
jgi:DNA-binding PadR family transcriptional regulator